MNDELANGELDAEGRLTGLDWMLVETPVPESELNRTPKTGHKGENRCSYCVGAGDLTWYPNEDVMVIRHWKSTSQDVPGGGHWTWYCPDHFERRRGRWWRNSHRAPARLLPEVRHDCVRDIGLRAKCGLRAVEPVDGSWFCEVHAVAARNLLRLEQMGDDDPFDD